jgi:hypothetical protein
VAVDRLGASWFGKLPLVGAALDANDAAAISHAWSSEAAAATYERAADDAIKAMRSAATPASRNASFESAKGLLEKAAQGWQLAASTYRDLAGYLAASTDPSAIDLRSKAIALASRDDAEATRLQDRMVALKTEWRDIARGGAGGSPVGLGTLALAAAALGGAYALGAWPALAHLLTRAKESIT